MSEEILKHILNTASSKPGVYQMYNAKGQLIYVGKARNIKKRLTQYFQKNLDNIKTKALMSHVADIKSIITESENEALLLEANLIKQHRPRYNVLLRDDKSYPYLYLTTQQDFPRLDIHRGSRKLAGRFFGPYPSASSLRNNLTLIQKLFRLRSCKDGFFKNRTRPCLQYQIKRCTAPCVSYVTKENYAEQVREAILFLEGKDAEIIKSLEKKMDFSSDQRDYEQAAFFRDKISQLRYIQSEQSITHEHGNIDVLGIAEEHGDFAVSVLFVRAGRMLGKKVFIPNVPRDTTISEALSSFISQYYIGRLGEELKLDKLILDCKISDKSWFESSLQEKYGKRFKLIDRRMEKYKTWQSMAERNAKHHLMQHLSNQSAAIVKLDALRKLLGIKDPIRRVECFDISHTQGDSTVASCVVYTEQGPMSKEYRRFNIKDITPGDDYAAMRQVLSRRYSRLKKEEASLPDLVIVDGGKAQLKQAIEVMEELQLTEIELLGIAKGVSRKPGLEKLLLAGKERAIIAPHDSIGLHLIQFIRDESHRFAITGHRKKRAAGLTESPLDCVPGVGAKRKREILRYFGGLREVQKASIQELMKVSGVSEALAKKIYDALHE